MISYAKFERELVYLKAYLKQALRWNGKQSKKYYIEVIERAEKWIKKLEELKNNFENNFITKPPIKRMRITEIKKIGTPWKHKKTGKTYYVLGGAINATNAQDGQVMIFYVDELGFSFVREYREFHEKFEKIEMENGTRGEDD